MAKKADKNEQKITIDNIEYSLEDLSENAKSQLANIHFVDNQIQQLENELAVSDTARIGYTKALKRELEKAENAE